MGSLPELFRQALPPALSSAWDDALGPRLTEILATARRAWPGIDLDDDTFVVWLGARLAESPISEALARIQAADLYLTCACVRHDARALAQFERTLGPDLDGALAQLALAPADREDIAQTVHEELFVRRTLAKYSGRGALRY